jgi:uncharacterized protein (DUF342 family)
VLYAAKDGYVVRSGVRISVENVLEVNNVGAETGNIRFHGVVRVHGQVEDHYLVEAEKGIEVAGTVGHARLVTKGDLRVRGGVIGAELEAEGNVTARFLSESKVRAGLNVLVEEYVLHSEVEAKRAVKVLREPEGFIQGGRVKAGTEIWSPVLGSEASEQHTVLEVGGGVNVRQRFDALSGRITANLEAFDKMRKNLLYLQRQREEEGPPEGRRKETYEQNLASARKLCEDLLRQGSLHQGFLEQLAHPIEEGGMVFVSQMAHPGALVQIQTQRVHLRDPMESCAFVSLSGSLKAMPYGTALKLHKQRQARKPRLTT